MTNGAKTTWNVPDLGRLFGHHTAGSIPVHLRHHLPRVWRLATCRGVPSHQTRAGWLRREVAVHVDDEMGRGGVEEADLSVTANPHEDRVRNGLTCGVVEVGRQRRCNPAWIDGDEPGRSRPCDCHVEHDRTGAGRYVAAVGDRQFGDLAGFA